MNNLDQFELPGAERAFNLAGEETIDGAKVQAEAEAQAQAAAEAKAKQEREQLPLDLAANRARIDAELKGASAAHTIGEPINVAASVQYQETKGYAFTDSEVTRARAEAARIAASAEAISDSSEYPRVAKMACAGQVEALQHYADTVEAVGTIPPKRSGMTGEERRARRADLLRLRAAKQQVKAADAHRTSHDIGAHIPFGQPILVGHHSERGHRRAIERMHNATSRAVAAGNYAEELDRRADHVERSSAIQQSDSDAVEQYRAKLTRLESERDNMKAVNAAFRQAPRDGGEALRKLGLSDDAIQRLQDKISTAYSWEKQPFPKWQISNLGAVIRDARQKLEAAEKRATMPAQTIDIETESAGAAVRFEDSPQDNRVRLYFAGKPEAQIRAGLKRNGFRWAPSLGCWQAFRNWRSMEHAKTFVPKTS